MNVVQAVDRAHRAWRGGDIELMHRTIKRGLQIAPRHPILLSFWAECQLLRGNWSPQVWRMWNRTRWYSAAPAALADYVDMKEKWPEWDGEESLSGVPILVWDDGGIGDAVMFHRYRALLEAMGAEVLWHVPESRAGLFEGSALPGPVTAACFTTVQSLPGCFHTTPDTVPPEIRPWGERSEERTGRIAACWRGNASHMHDKFRSIDVPPLWANELEALPTDGPWQRTIGALRGIDLLISVDTAVAHVAAALGVRVWLLVATVQDWRWLTKRPDTPWYKTVEIFRQTEPGDWTGCLAEVKERLHALV